MEEKRNAEREAYEQYLREKEQVDGVVRKIVDEDIRT